VRRLKDEDCQRLVKPVDNSAGSMCWSTRGNHEAHPAPAHGPLDATGSGIFAVNVIGTYQMTRAAAALEATGDAAIVNISSVGAMRAGGSSMAYTPRRPRSTISRSRPRALAPEVRVNASARAACSAPGRAKS
jgi:NAD(P)-dependent dehydrogenase (short-subunit alcohol dehydrogenase family)